MCVDGRWKAISWSPKKWLTPFMKLNSSPTHSSCWKDDPSQKKNIYKMNVVIFIEYIFGVFSILSATIHKPWFVIWSAAHCTSKVRKVNNHLHNDMLLSTNCRWHELRRQRKNFNTFRLETCKHCSVQSPVSVISVATTVFKLFIVCCLF